MTESARTEYAVLGPAAVGMKSNGWRRGLSKKGLCIHERRPIRLRRLRPRYLAHLDTLDYLRNTAPVRITHEVLDTLRRVSDRTGEEYEAILARLLADEDGRLGSSAT